MQGSQAGSEPYTQRRSKRAYGQRLDHLVFNRIDAQHQPYARDLRDIALGTLYDESGRPRVSGTSADRFVDGLAKDIKRPGGRQSSLAVLDSFCRSASKARPKRMSQDNSWTNTRDSEVWDSLSKQYASKRTELDTTNRIDLASGSRQAGSSLQDCRQGSIAAESHLSLAERSTGGSSAIRQGDESQESSSRILSRSVPALDCGTSDSPYSRRRGLDRADPNAATKAYKARRSSRDGCSSGTRNLRVSGGSASSRSIYQRPKAPSQLSERRGPSSSSGTIEIDGIPMILTAPITTVPQETLFTITESRAADPGSIENGKASYSLSDAWKVAATEEGTLGTPSVTGQIGHRKEDDGVIKTAEEMGDLLPNPYLRRKDLQSEEGPTTSQFNDAVTAKEDTSYSGVSAEEPPNSDELVVSQDEYSQLLNSLITEYSRPGH